MNAGLISIPELTDRKRAHGHSMEQFSHWEIGLDKYAISWGAYFIIQETGDIAPVF